MVNRQTHTALTCQYDRSLWDDAQQRLRREYTLENISRWIGSQDDCNHWWIHLIDY